MNLPRPQRSPRYCGRADYFDNRRKLLFLKIAQLKSTDVLYDLGCGNANLLIYVAKQQKLKQIVGFERVPSRVKTARKNIKAAGLQHKIKIRNNNFCDDVDFSTATVIFDMLPESPEYEKPYFGKLKEGTRVIKHDLPLIGYFPDKVLFPFYMMKSPFKKVKTKDQWAREVLQDYTSKISDLWYELCYYQYEKGYYRDDIKYFEALLKKRLRC